MSKQSQIATGNLVCIKHPHYTGETNPELSCKVCCSKFVARIRAEQAMKFETTWTTSLPATKKADFQPMKISQPSSKQAKRNANLDSSWL
jgi:hypothetical protein